jgi:hypothetical protein
VRIDRAKALSESEALRWEEVRVLGKPRFIWTQGVLRWGGMMWAFSLGLFQHAHFGSVFSLEGAWEVRWVVATLTWVLVGYGYGRSLWHRTEERYHAYLALMGKSRFF